MERKKIKKKQKNFLYEKMKEGIFLNQEIFSYFIAFEYIFFGMSNLYKEIRYHPYQDYNFSMKEVGYINY